MTDNHKRLWTLADYQSFLQHSDPIIRGWAAHCIEEQYPDQTAESFVGLLTDSDSHLQITAAGAIGNSGDIRFEQALLAVWPESKGPVRNWLTRALGQLRSQTILADLIAEVEAIPAQPLSNDEKDMLWLLPHSATEALGYYPAEAARTALWQLFERYPVDDRLTFVAVEGLLRFIKPGEFTRLVQRWIELKPEGNMWWQAFRALAQAANLEGLVLQLADLEGYDSDELLEFLDYWFLQEIPYSEAFEIAIDQSADNEYAGILVPMLVELERVVAERGDDLTGWSTAWQGGERPRGYRERMVYAHQLLTALTTHPPRHPRRHWEAVVLGLALLAQALVDQDDEAALLAAPNEMFRQATLLSILGSTRPNVWPDIVERVAVLGPEAIPHLIEMLEGDNVWAWLRALRVIQKIARQQPGMADRAVPAILDLMHLEQGDEVMERASSALIAIGPGAVEPIGERLGQDYSYDIFAGGALAHIPTDASVAVWLHHLAHQPAIEEYDLEGLGDLGHPAAIPFLRDNFEWRNDPLLCTVLYKLAVINNYTGPELDHWRTVAVQDYEAFVRSRETGQVKRPVSQQPQQTVKKQQKDKRKQTKAQRRKQQKKKKRRRR